VGAEELGVPYEHRPEKPRSMAVRMLNPSGKVPVMLDGDAVLTDSTAIVQYLADKHGSLTFPAGTVDRARQDGWTHAILDELEGPLWTAARHTFALPHDMRLPAIKESLRWEYAGAIERMAKQVPETDWLMGDRFTVPDILLAHCLRWAEAAHFPSHPPSMNAYLIRVGHRPAFQRAMAMRSS
jgi:glutathione S-transferase